MHDQLDRVVVEMLDLLAHGDLDGLRELVHRLGQVFRLAQVFCGLGDGAFQKRDQAASAAAA